MKLISRKKNSVLSLYFTGLLWYQMVWDEHINQQDLEFILPLLYSMEDIITLMSWVVYTIIIMMLLLVINIVYQSTNYIFFINSQEVVTFIIGKMIFQTSVQFI